MIEINRLYMVTYAGVFSQGNMGFVHVDSGDFYYVTWEEFNVALRNPNSYFINWNESGYTQGSLQSWIEKVARCRTAVDRSAVFLCYKIKNYPTMLGKKDYYYCIGEDGVAKGFITESDIRDLYNANRLVNARVDKNGVIRLNADSILTYTPEEYNDYMKRKDISVNATKKSFLGTHKSIQKYDILDSNLNDKQKEYLKERKASGKYKGMIS